MSIHPTAIISKSANIDSDVTICPYVIIGNECRIDKGCIIHPHAVIGDFTFIGKNCQIFTGAIVGSISQDLKFQGKESFLEIGNNNIIREYATINRSTSEGKYTKIGDNNLIMAYAHIAHDCQIGNNTIISNLATLAGHVIIEDNAIVGGLSGIHQFVRVGRLSMIGGLSKITQDVPPFMLVEGNPTVVYGLNKIGLDRNNFTLETKRILKQAYKIIYRSKFNLSRAIIELTKLPQIDELVYLINFLKNTKRGICGLNKHFR